MKKVIEEGGPRGPSGVWPSSKRRYDTDFTSPHTLALSPSQLTLNIDSVLIVFGIHRNLNSADWLRILNTKSNLYPTVPIIEICPPKNPALA